MKLPHENVYVRIGRSKLHGAGVIAIRDILKGKVIFFGEREKISWVKKSIVDKLPKELKKLYTDFCVEQKGWYAAPRTFNKLTPSWYMNHSGKPNVGFDKRYRYFALRKIKKGEELTVDYVALINSD